MALTQENITIINQAYSLIGVGLLELGRGTLREDYKQAELNYPRIRQAALVSSNWSWTIFKKKLTTDKTQTSDSIEYPVSFDLPQDRLKSTIESLFNERLYGNSIVRGWEIQGDKLYMQTPFTDPEDNDKYAVWIEYQRDVPESQWEHLFSSYVVYQVAIEFVDILTRDEMKKKSLQQALEINGFYSKALAQDSINRNKKINNRESRLLKAHSGYETNDFGYPFGY